jgi:hypothetical protein
MPALLIQVFLCARATAAISRPGLKFAFFRIIEDVPTVPTPGDTCRINPNFAYPRPVTLTSAEYPNGPSVSKRRKVKEAEKGNDVGVKQHVELVEEWNGVEEH